MSQADNFRALLARVSDAVAGFERLSCPHCRFAIRFRAVSAREAKRLRQQMADHVAGHTA